ncbi:Hypothetical protein CINCED_3A015247 [Cinara cedri]|uniref:Uncharacterized protein n=1 Tax=Cinara cedri TaxID=506608 RepID=A0A5E4MYZ8_9HEMI|nr:Hypothetical protein CINCED_3A015247 [Cinara cedri]
MSVNSPNPGRTSIPEKRGEVGENEIQQIMKLLKKSSAEQQKSNADLKKMIHQAYIEQTPRLAAFQVEITAHRKECVERWQRTDVLLHMVEEAKVTNDHRRLEQTAING